MSLLLFALDMSICSREDALRILPWLLLRLLKSSLDQLEISESSLSKGRFSTGGVIACNESWFGDSLKSHKISHIYFKGAIIHTCVITYEKVSSPLTEQFKRPSHWQLWLKEGITMSYTPIYKYRNTLFWKHVNSITMWTHFTWGSITIFCN